MDYLDFYAGAFITSKDGPLCQYEPSDDMCHYSRKNYFQNTIFVSHANTKGSKIDVEIAVIFHTGKLKGYLVKFETVKEFISTYFPNSKIQKRSPEKLFFLVPSLKNENYCLKKQIAAIEAKNINHLIQLKKKYTATVENVRAEYNRFLEKEGAASKDITNIHNYICPVYRLTIDEEHELKNWLKKVKKNKKNFLTKFWLNNKLKILPEWKKGCLKPNMK